MRTAPKYVPGTPLADVLLGDAVLEIDIIPNIARCARLSESPANTRH